MDGVCGDVGDASRMSRTSSASLRWGVGVGVGGAGCWRWVEVEWVGAGRTLARTWGVPSTGPSRLPTLVSVTPTGKAGLTSHTSDFYISKARRG